MREWIVGGGLVLGDAGLLLVRNRRRDGSHDWSPPGGVIEDGEALVDGLTREVAEETGVEVLAWDGPAYEVVVTAPGLGWRARVEAHVATAFRGELRVDDPDGIVVEAAWVDPASCGQQLQGVHRWVREPLMAWLDAAIGEAAAAAGAATPSAAATARPAVRIAVDVAPHTRPVTPPTFRYHVTGQHPGTAVVTRIGADGTGSADDTDDTDAAAGAQARGGRDR